VRRLVRPRFAASSQTVRSSSDPPVQGWGGMAPVPPARPPMARSAAAPPLPTRAVSPPVPPLALAPSTAGAIVVALRTPLARVAPEPLAARRVVLYGASLAWQPAVTHSPRARAPLDGSALAPGAAIIESPVHRWA